MSKTASALNLEMIERRQTLAHLNQSRNCFQESLARFIAGASKCALDQLNLIKCRNVLQSNEAEQAVEFIHQKLLRAFTVHFGLDLEELIMHNHRAPEVVESHDKARLMHSRVILKELAQKLDIPVEMMNQPLIDPLKETAQQRR